MSIIINFLKIYFNSLNLRCLNVVWFSMPVWNECHVSYAEFVMCVMFVVLCVVPLLIMIYGFQMCHVCLCHILSVSLILCVSFIMCHVPCVTCGILYLLYMMIYGVVVCHVCYMSCVFDFIRFDVCHMS